MPDSSPLEDRLLSEPLPTKAVSCTYRKLCNNLPDSFLALRAQWQMDIGPLEDDDWQNALMSPKVTAINHRHHLIQLKILHRSYFSGVLLAKIGGRTNALCLRGCGQESTFYHTLWDCPEIHPLWNKATQKFKDTLGKQLQLTPRLGILNVWDATDLTEIEQQWVALGYLLVKRAIAMLGGSKTKPLMIGWVAEMDRCMIAEKEVYKLRGCPKK